MLKKILSLYDRSQNAMTVVNMKTHKIIITVTCVIILLLLSQFARIEAWITPKTDFITFPGCLLQAETCHATLDDKTLSLSVEPKKIATLVPLTFNVKINNISASKVVLDLNGKEMFMGINRTILHQVSDSNWEGITELAVCTTGEMIWEASVKIYNQSDSTPLTATFEFSAK